MKNGNTNIQKNNDISVDHLEEGSLCHRKFDRKSGYCLLAIQCIHAIRDFRVHGIPVDICGYKKKVPIICCPLDLKEVDTRGRRLSARSKYIYSF